MVFDYLHPFKIEKCKNNLSITCPRVHVAMAAGLVRASVERQLSFLSLFLSPHFFVSPSLFFFPSLCSLYFSHCSFSLFFSHCSLFPSLSLSLLHDRWLLLTSFFPNKTFYGLVMCFCMKKKREGVSFFPFSVNFKANLFSFFFCACRSYFWKNDPLVYI